MIAVAVILTAIAAFATGFAVGRAPSVPSFYEHRPKVPVAKVLLDRVRDRRADITVAMRGHR